MQHSDTDRPTLETLSQILRSPASLLDMGTLSNETWDALAHRARAEGVGPLLYWTLSGAGQFASLPAAIQKSLRDAYVRTVMRNQAKFRELEAISRLFEQAEIPAVALKGVCFALTIYPDIGLRPMNDIDILVPRAKLDKAVGLAKSLGYQENTFPVLSRVLRDFPSHHVFLQKKGDDATVLELHHNLIASESSRYFVPADWFWEQTEALAGNAQMRFKNLLMLAPTAQVLYAASHAMLQHGGNSASLQWFYDIDRLVRSYPDRIDWDLLLSQARTFEWGSALDAALSQTRAYFNTPVPGHVHANLLEKPDRNRELILQKQIRPVTYVHAVFRRLFALDDSTLNGYHKLQLVIAHVVPGPAYMRWRYQTQSTWALLIYYPFRWWGILKNVLRTVILLRKRSQIKDT